ncbi:MAG: hypothetical protein P8L18_15210 [Verrucomicrobiota bacterium]|nr:hypothetical protein [Verrucomicrobiota bacterium]
MKKIFKTILFGWLSCVAFFHSFNILHGMEKGRTFPHQAFPALKDGRAISLKDYLGQKVVLHIFASW